MTAIVTNKVRSLLTMLGIIIGVASVILLVSIGTGLQAFVTSQFESLGSNVVFVLPGKVDLKSGPSRPTALISKFKLEDVFDIKKIGNPVRDVSPMTQVSATLRYKDETVTVPVIGVWESVFAIRRLTPKEGHIIVQGDIERNKKSIVLGSKAATDLYGSSPAVGKTLTLNEVRYTVVGVLESKGGGGLGVNVDEQVYIPLSTALRQFDQTNPYMLLIETVDQQSVGQASEKVKQVLGKRLKDDEFTVVTQTELLSTINQFLGTITVALSGIAAISLIVGGIGIMNIMLVSVTERTREIGLRKAVGAQGRDILLQFLIEAIVLSSVGGGIGIALGALGSLLLSSFIKTSVPFWAVALAFGFSATVGVVFGVAPAIRASRLDPITALRYE